ncbi:MAG: hypothetical protein JNM78_07580 [Cyclobacteriaceae bacterium]|nr:hypothetical protein [Cyclobacteriaceae bacterium]
MCFYKQNYEEPESRLVRLFFPQITLNLLEVHHKQVITYLTLSGIKLGLLVNFNCSEIDKSIFRKINGL